LYEFRAKNIFQKAQFADWYNSDHFLV